MIVLNQIPMEKKSFLTWCPACPPHKTFYYENKFSSNYRLVINQGHAPQCNENVLFPICLIVPPPKKKYIKGMFDISKSKGNNPKLCCYSLRTTKSKETVLWKWFKGWTKYILFNFLCSESWEVLLKNVSN